MNNRRSPRWGVGGMPGLCYKQGAPTELYYIIVSALKQESRRDNLFIEKYIIKLEQPHQSARSLPQKGNWAQIAKIIDGVVLQAINTDIPVADLLAAGQEKIALIDKPDSNE